jgi:hypothetical protein
MMSAVGGANLTRKRLNPLVGFRKFGQGPVTALK